MASKTLFSVKEYLHTSFEEADCEYLDGEVVERNMGERPHGLLQLMLGHMLLELQLGLEVIPEMRVQITPTRYRVADLAVWRKPNPGERIPKAAPFLIVEILSPEDRMVRMQPKIQEYLSIGAEWVWVIDPEERKALCYSQENREGSVCDVLRTGNPTIEFALEDVLKRANV